MYTSYNEIQDWINEKCGYDHVTMEYRIFPLDTTGTLLEIATAFNNNELEKASALIEAFETEEAINSL